jgi:hypothetical protein
VRHCHTTATECVCVCVCVCVRAERRILAGHQLSMQYIHLVLTTGRYDERLPRKWHISIALEEDFFFTCACCRKCATVEGVVDRLLRRRIIKSEDCDRCTYERDVASLASSCCRHSVMVASTRYMSGVAGIRCGISPFVCSSGQLGRVSFA